MTEVLSSPYFVASLFFMVALVYSSVGLGGGSSYTALMAILGFNALAIPLLSLALNLMVTTVGAYHFIRHKHARIKLIAPFLVTSIPMAYIGGTLHLPKDIFYWVLLVSLIVVVLRIYFWSNTSFNLNLSERGKLFVSLIAGAILGLVAGIVGIGGGVYLVPLIIILGLGTTKEAAACGVIFIWMNSLSGLLARLQYNAIDFADYTPLIVAVFMGGAIGSFLGATKYPAKFMEKILGIIILVAIIFLLKKVILVA